MKKGDYVKHKGYDNPYIVVTYRGPNFIKLKDSVGNEKIETDESKLEILTEKPKAFELQGKALPRFKKI